MPQCVIKSNMRNFLIAPIDIKIRLWIENMTIHSLTNGSSDIITDNRNATRSPGNCTEWIGPGSAIANDRVSMIMAIFY